jgi:hypothetical protein
MTHKIVKSEEFSACLKETQSNDTLKSTYYGIYIILNVFGILIFKLM